MSPDEEEQTDAVAEPAPADAAVAEEESPAPETPAAEASESVAEASAAREGESAEAAASEKKDEEGERPRRGRDDRESEGDDDRHGGGRRRFFGRRKVCTFCVEKATSIDYKDPAKLRRYVSDRGRIEARRRTGTCAKHQRWVAVALKRARHLALLPYSPEHIRISGAFAPRR